MERNYYIQAESVYNEGQMAWGEVAEFFQRRFELEAEEELTGCEQDDVGGVVLYLRGNEEVAYFDYENMYGKVHG